jgi:hypothetical protein
VGDGVGDGVRDGVGDGVGDGVRDGVGEGVGDGEGVRDGDGEGVLVADGAAAGADDGWEETTAADALCPGAAAAELAGGRGPCGAVPLAGQNASRPATSVPAASIMMPTLTAGGIAVRARVFAGTGAKLIVSPDPVWRVLRDDGDEHISRRQDMRCHQRSSG